MLSTSLLYSFVVSFHVALAIRCLSCNGTREPWMCNVVRDCPRQYNSCALRRYLVSNSTQPHVVYDTFCSSNEQNCTVEGNIGPLSSALCETCCTADFCNSHGCGSYGHPVNRRLCFNCSQIYDPNACPSIALCQPGETCNSQAAIFGKRRDIVILDDCCTTDFCNIPKGGIRPNLPSPNPPTDPIVNGTGNKEFLVLFPDDLQDDNLYVLLSSETSGDLQIEVGFPDKKIWHLPLTAGANYISLDSTYKSLFSLYYPKAVYLKATVPVSVFAIKNIKAETSNLTRTSEYSEGFMVFPIEKLGTQYRVFCNGGYLEFTIAALHRNTNIKVKVHMNTVGHGYIDRLPIDGVYLNDTEVHSHTMQRLDTITSRGNLGFSGTTIYSDKPIAVVAGDFVGDVRDMQFEYLPPVSMYRTLYIVPPFPETAGYDIDAMIANDGEIAQVNITTKSRYRTFSNIGYFRKLKLQLDSEMSVVESSVPIILAAFPHGNSTSGIAGTMAWIPSIDQYRSKYTIASPDIVEPGKFKQYVTIVIPVSDKYGLLMNGSHVTSNVVNPSLSVNSVLYTFLTIRLHGPYNVISHKTPNVKFGAFVTGMSQPHGYSRYAFPAGIL